jgi:hypothetical protein
MITGNDVEIIVELAKEAEVGDPFDWGSAAISEDDAYKLVAMSVVELEDNPLILKASLTKLIVENMVLNVRIMENAKTN